MFDFPSHKRVTTVTKIAKPLGRCSSFVVTNESHMSQLWANRVVGAPCLQFVTGLKRVTTVTKDAKPLGRCSTCPVTRELQRPEKLQIAWWVFGFPDHERVTSNRISCLPPAISSGLTRRLPKSTASDLMPATTPRGSLRMRQMYCPMKPQ